MSETPKTALEAIREACARSGVTLHEVEPEPGTGALIFLARRHDEKNTPQESTLRDDDTGVASDH